MENTNSTTALDCSRKGQTNGSTVQARKGGRQTRPGNHARLTVAHQAVKADAAGQAEPAAAPTPESVDARASTAAEKLSGQFALGRPGDFLPSDLIDTARMVARQARRKPGAVVRATVGFAG